MKETSYYELKMPDSNDTIDVSVLNNNMKRLDDVLILTVIGRNAETSEFVKKCCAPYIMIQNLGEETVTIYDRRWPEDMWEDNKIVIEPTKFHIYRVANSVNANFLVLDNKECNFRYFITAEQAIAEGGGGGGGGTTDYNELDNQPKINGFTLIGNKSFKELGLLNDDGKIKSDYLPPFVDNMDSYDTEADFPRPGVEDRLYLDKSTNLAYVWAGTDYACIGTPLALGITHETAGYGDESRAAYNHSLSEHARVDATKTEGSSQNGYVKINGEETKVYEHPGSGTNPHGTTKTDVGLGNVLDAKQVTVTEQAYSETEKAQARNNIGAGTSSFSGKYSDLTEIPSEFTPAEHNHDDLYAHKTSVSSSNETTSVINVTDAKAQMAMVASIKGKTVKTRNLANLRVKAESTVAGVKSSITNNLVTASGTSTGNGDIVCYLDKNFELKNGEKITVSLQGSVSCVNCTVFVFNLTTSSYPIYQKMEGYKATLTAAGDYDVSAVLIRVPNGVSISGNFNIMIEKGSTSTTYEPYFEGLHSAPVESVVSTISGNASIIDNRLLTNNKDNMNVRSNRSSTIPVECVNKTLAYEATSKTGKSLDTVIVGYGANGAQVYDSNWTGKSKNIYTFSDNVAYVGIGVRYTDESDIIAGDISVEWNQLKTTVLVPSSVKNLPDYGCSVGDIANEIDFENGVYYHRVVKVKLSSLTFNPDSSLLAASKFIVVGFSNTYKIKKPSSSSATTNAISGVYTNSSVNAYLSSDKTMAFANDLNIHDSRYTTMSAFLAANANTEIVVELETPEVIPLSDYLRPLPVENGGTLTLVNPHNLDVNSTIKYKKEI